MDGVGDGWFVHYHGRFRYRELSFFVIVMKKSTLYSVVTLPNTLYMLPRTYAATILPFSFIIGGGAAWLLTGQPIALFGGFLLLGGILWAIGAVKASKDPEFFDVWLLNRTKIQGDSTSDSSYEP